MLRWLVVFAVLGGCALGPTPPPAPPRQAKLGLGFSGGRLPNGLRVVLVSDPQATEVQVTMRYGVGAADDPVGAEGMAHLVEHLMFDQVLGGQSLFEQLDTVTSMFNATTTFDATTYVARAEPARLDKLLAIDAVRVGFRCTTITPAEFEREREVVINEIRLRDRGSELYTAVHSGLYPENHPYRRAIGGSVATVSAITFEDACKFADAHYTPENAVLVVSGNITPSRVEQALGKFLGRIAKRPAPIRRQVTVASQRDERQEVTAPLDRDALLVAWPVPVEPLLQVRVRALSGAVTQTIDSAVAGRVEGVWLGDERAPMFGVVVELTEKDKVNDVMRAIDEALGELPWAFNRVRVGSLDEVGFSAIQQRAIHALYARLEDGSGRDETLASYVLNGRAPEQALADEFQGLREMTHHVAASLVREHLSYDKASIVVLRAGEVDAYGSHIVPRPPVHDRGARLALVDPAVARRPLDHAERPRVTARMTTRKLPNGLTVVRLPLASVPTVELRLVFGSGTADELVTKRGAAIVAGQGLGWSARYANDLVAFFAAGGTGRVVVEADRTSFHASGVDMHIDMLLAGLRRWVREGIYDDAGDVVDALRAQRKQADESTTFTDAWRAALWGEHHPYVKAGLLRHASPSLTIDDAAAFRAEHYTPDNATLVISGHFDAALADRWVDFLFADWTGTRPSVPEKTSSTPAPAALAMLATTTTVQLSVALPVGAGNRAQRLVAAAMLAEVTRDVRLRLGAAYVVEAALSEARYGSHYRVDAVLDATRATPAVSLLRDRLRALRENPDDAARAFISARKRVLAQLHGTTGSAAALADRVEVDLELGRPPLADLETIEAVRALTIDALVPLLGDLDLSRGVMMMRGPLEPVKDAYAAIDRTPRFVMFDQVSADTTDTPIEEASERKRARENVSVDDVEDALTGGDQRVATRLSLLLGVGYGALDTVEPDLRLHPECCTGVHITAKAGYRLDRKTTVGLRFATAFSNGDYSIDLDKTRYPMSLVPVDIGAFIELEGYNRLFGGVALGVHFDRITDASPDTTSDMTVWNSGLGIGIWGGVDALILRGHRVALYGSIDGTLANESGYSGFALGVGYRR